MLEMCLIPITITITDGRLTIIETHQVSRLRVHGTLHPHHSERCSFQDLELQRLAQDKLRDALSAVLVTANGFLDLATWVLLMAVRRAYLTHQHYTIHW